jgi:hypothetical protein
VTFFAEDDDLGIRYWMLDVGNTRLKLFLNTFLQLKHNRAGGIDNLNVVVSCHFIGLRWLTVGAQQHLHVMQMGHFIVTDGYQAHLPQAFTFHSIVDNVTQAVERMPLCQFFLGFLDGCSHAEAEAASVVYLNLHVMGVG